MNIWFIYAEAIGFSGQYEASRILLEGLQSDRVHVAKVEFPALRRARSSAWTYLLYASRLLQAWLRCLPLVWRVDDSVHINMGQTTASLVRDAVPLMIGSMVRRRVTAVALHGNAFTGWRELCLKAKFFAYLLNRVTVVSVLSERQKAFLISMGVRVRIEIVPNACDAVALRSDQIVAKHSSADRLMVLHMSSLIASKGYPDFLEALEIYGKNATTVIDAVLCGRFVGSQYSSRLNTESEAEAWIQCMMDRIASTGRVNIKWVRGAYGEEKWRLFEKSHVFVFPSAYAVEAQPIVLIEAIAQGLICLSTTVGDIGTIFPSGGFLEISGDSHAGPKAMQIAEYLRDLSSDRMARLGLAQASAADFKRLFTKDAYLSRWREILCNCRLRS